MNEFVEKVLNLYVGYQALNDSNRLRSKAIAAAIDRRLVMLEKNLCVTSFGAMGFAVCTKRRQRYTGCAPGSHRQRRA